MKNLKKRLSNLDEIIDVQCSNGNWNCNAYMMGLANGLIMARSLFDDKEPNFLDRPKKWLDDISLFQKINLIFKKPRPFAVSCDEESTTVNVLNSKGSK
jgi:hypothetical protein